MWFWNFIPALLFFPWSSSIVDFFRHIVWCGWQNKKGADVRVNTPKFMLVLTREKSWSRRMDGPLNESKRSNNTLTSFAPFFVVVDNVHVCLCVECEEINNQEGIQRLKEREKRRARVMITDVRCNFLHVKPFLRITPTLLSSPSFLDLFYPFDASGQGVRDETPFTFYQSHWWLSSNDSFKQQEVDGCGRHHLQQGTWTCLSNQCSI